MCVSKKNISAFAILSIAAFSTAASAQFGSSAFALQLHDSITSFERVTERATVRVERLEIQGNSYGFFVQLNNGTTGSNISFDSMPELGQRNTVGTRGFVDIADSRTPAPKTDTLTIVPLPPAAFAGLGLLAGVAGIRAFRRMSR